MSRTLVVDLQQAKWQAIHDAVVRFRTLRNKTPTYVIFLVQRALEQQLSKLLDDYELSDVSEVRQGGRAQLTVLSPEEFSAL